MPIAVDSRRKKAETLNKLHPGAVILDVTSKGPLPWVRFSPFWPHGGIPIPGRDGEVAASVEGLWQGLKVFEHEGVDPSRWAVTTMTGLKRAGRTRGGVLGHRWGADGLLSYREARRRIYLPAYRWVLERHLSAEVAALRELPSAVLLDYETNGDVSDLSRPLSHAALVKAFAEGSWPNGGE